MNKRLLSGLLSLLLLLCAFPLSCVASDGKLISLTINGKTVSQLSGITLEELLGTNEQLVYAAVTDESGNPVSFITDPSHAFTADSFITLRTLRFTSQKTTVRQVSPSGVRFETAIEKEGMDTLLSDPRVLSVSLGTLILPLETLPDLQPLIHEGIVDMRYLDVAATPGKWYAESGQAYHFAGSIVNIKDQNHNRVFGGRGYVSVTLDGIGTVTLYASYPEDNGIPRGTYSVLAHELLKNTEVTLSKSEIQFFKSVARKGYALDLNGLNVLAIGDSLFDGDKVAGNKQWIGILANECKWNFTNLGYDGWTVAYNPSAYPEGATVRKSMYDYLFNRSDTYKFGGDGSYSTGSPYTKGKETVDLILLEGGTNDYGWNIPLGTVDSRDPSNLLGAWNLMIERLLEDYPNAQIVLVTSWHIDETRSDGSRRMDFVADGMKSIYQTYYESNPRVALIDAGDPSVSGINMADQSFRARYAVTYNDKNHLNAVGMRTMANSMFPLLWELMSDRT